MTKKDLIIKLTDYVLLNSCSVTSFGLYNGKAGLSLALFEAARYLQDDYIEDQAFELLQECLLAKTQDIGFENGMSGIGWALLYLTNNKFINADFDEVFEEQYEKIIAKFDEIESKPHNLLQSRRIIYFLSAIAQQRPNDKRIAPIIRALFEAIEVYLSVHLFDLTDIHYIDNKPNVLRILESYLRLAHYTQYSDISYSVLDDYATIYRSRKLTNSYYIGHYMGKILDSNTFEYYEDIIIGNKKDFYDTLCVNALSLGERIDLSKIQNENASSKINLLTEWSEHPDIFSFETQLSQSIPVNVFWAGYQSGISRYLIYNVNKNAILL